MTTVSGNGLQGMAAREQFSLRFRGPVTLSLPQRIYRTRRVGALDTFPVPIRHDTNGMTYEAV